MHNLKKKTDIYLIISNNIKKYRLVNNMTQRELARKSGYSYSYIRRMEGPKCAKSFSIQALENIASVLDVDIKHLFEEDNI